MTYLLGVVFYTGAACVSPVVSAERTTVVSKVPCAEVVRMSSANPFKIVQEPNVVSLAQPKERASSAKALPKYSYTKKPKKKKRKARR